jgi:hypothetical protein
MPPWYILVPLMIIVPVWLAYDTSKDKVLEWKDKVKENIRARRGKRMQKQKLSEKELFMAAYDDGNML